MAEFNEPNHRKRCCRYNDVGHAHALTFSCFQRQPFLIKDRSRQWFIAALDEARRKHRLDLWAYVIMPEHVHLLVWPRQAEYSVSRFLKSMKQSVARKAVYFVRRYAPTFLPRMEDRQPDGSVVYRFWQRGGGYDRNLTEPTTIWAEVDYIHANPVRRRLCERPIEWFWSSAAEWEAVGSGPLTIDRDSFPMTPAG